jgi:hypothetical protein
MTFPTWKCHVCDEEREDIFISMAKRDVSEAHGLPPGTIGYNVMYCN